MTFFTRITTTAALALAVSGPLFAQGTGSEGYFQIYNNTANNLVISFYTNDGNGWSNNWLEGVEIAPSESATATFNAETGACDQVFAVGWLGSDGESEVIDEPTSIDICAASNLYLDDNETYYD